MKEINKIHVVDKILHENKQEMLLVYDGEFEMIGKLKIGDQIGETHIRFGNFNDYESFINTIDDGSDAEYPILNGYL